MMIITLLSIIIIIIMAMDNDVIDYTSKIIARILLVTFLSVKNN